MKFTQAKIHAFTPPIGKLDHEEYDDELTGFGARYRNGGGGSYFVKYKLHGKTERRTLGPVAKLTLDAARRLARECFGKIAQDISPQAEHRAVRLEAVKAEVETINVFGRQLESFVALQKSECGAHYLRDLERSLRRYFQPLHSSPIGQITRAQVAGLLERVSTENGRIASNRARSHISSFFAWAMQKGLVENNPVIGTFRHKPVARDRVLSEAELSKIWAALGRDEYSDIVRLLMLTGARREEIGGLRFAEINFAEAQIELRGERTKTGLPHIIPLSEPVRKILLDRREARPDREFVFGDDGYTTWSKPQKRLAAKVELEHWTPHDFRRSVSTLMHEKLDVPPHVVEACLGHIVGGVAGIYNRAKYLPQRREALARYADHIRRAHLQVIPKAS